MDRSGDASVEIVTRYSQILGVDDIWPLRHLVTICVYQSVFVECTYAITITSQVSTVYSLMSVIK